MNNEGYKLHVRNIKIKQAGKFSIRTGDGNLKPKSEGIHEQRIILFKKTDQFIKKSKKKLLLERKKEYCYVMSNLSECWTISSQVKKQFRRVLIVPWTDYMKKRLHFKNRNYKEPTTNSQIVTAEPIGNMRKDSLENLTPKEHTEAGENSE